ncbi:MAG: hypothetical protein WD073_00685 [Xanthobacteraceae bacterium]
MAAISGRGLGTLPNDEIFVSIYLFRAGYLGFLIRKFIERTSVYWERDCGELKKRRRTWVFVRSQNKDSRGLARAPALHRSAENQCDDSKRCAASLRDDVIIAATHQCRRQKTSSAKFVAGRKSAVYFQNRLSGLRELSGNGHT